MCKCELSVNIRVGVSEYMHKSCLLVFFFFLRVSLHIKRKGKNVINLKFPAIFFFITRHFNFCFPTFSFFISFGIGFSICDRMNEKDGNEHV